MQINTLMRDTNPSSPATTHFAARAAFMLALTLASTVGLTACNEETTEDDEQADAEAINGTLLVFALIPESSDYDIIETVAPKTAAPLDARPTILALRSPIFIQPDQIALIEFDTDDTVTTDDDIIFTVPTSVAHVRASLAELAATTNDDGTITWRLVVRMSQFWNISGEAELWVALASQSDDGDLVSEYLPIQLSIDARADRCTIGCAGAECGDDNCGSICGLCDADKVCNTAGTCVTPDDSSDDADTDTDTDTDAP